jgi:hypothetical protein
MLLITIKVVTTIILSKINVEMTITIPLSSVSSLILRNAPRKINVEGLITELKDCITKISIRPSSVIASLIKYSSVNIATTVHLLTL